MRNYLPKIPVTKIFIQSKSKDQINNPLVLITSYELMAKCEAQFMAMRFGVIILVSRRGIIEGFDPFSGLLLIGDLYFCFRTKVIR